MHLEYYFRKFQKFQKNGIMQTLNGRNRKWTIIINQNELYIIQ